MTTLRHQLDLALHMLEVRDMPEAARVVREFTGQVSGNAEHHDANAKAIAAARAEIAGGQAYATDHEAIEAALRRICPDVRHAMEESVDLVLSHLAKVQSATTGDGELLPCPFCGHSAFVGIQEVPNKSHGGTWYRAGCRGCSVSFPHNFQRDGAVREWNTRARPAAEREGEAMAVDDGERSRLYAACEKYRLALIGQENAMTEAQNQLDELRNANAILIIERDSLFRQTLSATTAPQPAAPVAEWSTDRVYNCKRCQAPICLPGYCVNCQEKPAAPVEVSEAMVTAAVNLLFAYNLRELDGMHMDEAIATKYRIMRRTLTAALECKRGGK